MAIKILKLPNEHGLNLLYCSSVSLFSVRFFIFLFIFFAMRNLVQMSGSRPEPCDHSHIHNNFKLMFLCCCHVTSSSSRSNGHGYNVCICSKRHVSETWVQRLERLYVNIGKITTQHGYNTRASLSSLRMNHLQLFWFSKYFMKMTKILWLQPPKCVLLFFVLLERKLNIFGFWTQNYKFKTHHHGFLTFYRRR